MTDQPEGMSDPAWLLRLERGNPSMSSFVGGEIARYVRQQQAEIRRLREVAGAQDSSNLELCKALFEMDKRIAELEARNERLSDKIEATRPYHEDAEISDDD